MNSFTGVRVLFNQFLMSEDFSFNEKSYGNSFWKKKLSNDDKLELTTYKNFCRFNKLKFEVVYSEYTRNNDYRKKFFEKNRGFLGGYYLCSYCGIPLRKENATVDHIFPIDKVSKSKFYQIVLKLFHINNVNDTENLAPACRHCNSKKGTKMGLWILLGFLGRYLACWYFVWTIIAIIILNVLRLII